MWRIPLWNITLQKFSRFNRFGFVFGIRFTPGFAPEWWRRKPYDIRVHAQIVYENLISSTELFYWFSAPEHHRGMAFEDHA
jgi:hypothetical protein